MSWSGFRRPVLAAMLSIFAIAPLLHPGYPIGRAGLLPVYNLTSLINAGPANWQMTHGDSFSYGSFLPYYLLGGLRFLSSDPYVLIKGLFLVSFATSGVAMYLLAKSCFARWSGEAGADRPNESCPEYLEWAAWLAAALYVYAPYHLASSYVLGDLGEALVFPLMPLAGWCLLKAITGRGWPRLWWAAISSTALFATLLSGSLFKLGTPEIAGATSTFVDLPALLSPVWSSGATPATGLPTQLGAIAIVLVLTAFATTFTTRSGRSKLGNSTKLLVGVAVVLVAMVLPWSALAWEVLGRLIEAPFRLLAPLALVTSLIGGAVVLLVEEALTRDSETGKVDAPSLSSLSNVSSGGAALALVVLTIAGSFGYLSPAYIEPVQPHEPTNARFGSEVLLLDYHLESDGKQGNLPTIRAGANFTLTLVWQALAPVKEDLTVFTHLIDSSGKVWAQQDNQPVKGQRPTSAWQSGNVVLDPYELTANADVPPGDYQIEVGLYDGATGERKTVLRDGKSDSRVLLGKMKVTP